MSLASICIDSFSVKMFLTLFSVNMVGMSLWALLIRSEISFLTPGTW